MDDCCHNWIIEPANGSTSAGVCRRCGEEREFKNSITQDNVWTQAKQTRLIASLRKKDLPMPQDNDLGGL